MSDARQPVASWPESWQPVIDAIGKEFGEDRVTWGADAVEATGLRRFLEPFEFDCALHYDRATAEKYGYSDVVAPVSYIRVAAIPPLWEPGEGETFPDADRNSQPAHWPRDGATLPMAPKTGAAFMTNVDWEFLRPVLLGDRLGLSGRRVVVSCTPKEIRVGKGAFVTIEQRIVNLQLEPVMLVRSTSFYYDPAPKVATR